MNLKYYFYIDEDIVDSLYNQVSKGPTSKKVIRGYTDKGNLNGEVGIKEIFPLTINADINCEQTKEQVIETQYEITIEEKISRLLEDEDIRRTYGYRIGEIIEYYGHPILKSHFICGKGVFSLESVLCHDKNGNPILVDNSKELLYSREESYIFFKYGSSTNNIKYMNEVETRSRDISYRLWEYYEDYSYPYSVEVCMSNKYMKRKVWSINSQTEIRKNFQFHILGLLRYCGDVFYTIDPFVVWL